MLADRVSEPVPVLTSIDGPLPSPIVPERMTGRTAVTTNSRVAPAVMFPPIVRVPVSLPALMSPLAVNAPAITPAELPV